MKLLTHNMLTSKAIKGVQTGFPLKIVVRVLALQVVIRKLVIRVDSGR